MKIEVVIPVVQYELAMDLLKQIQGNTLAPNRVIIVDNTDRPHFWFDSFRFPTDRYYSKTGRLNESWEVARSKLSPDCDYVTFLNDDIVIGNWFFQRVVETFEANFETATFSSSCADNFAEIDAFEVTGSKIDLSIIFI